MLRFQEACTATEAYIYWFLLKKKKNKHKTSIQKMKLSYFIFLILNRADSLRFLQLSGFVRGAVISLTRMLFPVSMTVTSESASAEGSLACICKLLGILIHRCTNNWEWDHLLRGNSVWVLQNWCQTASSGRCWCFVVPRSQFIRCGAYLSREALNAFCSYWTWESSLGEVKSHTFCFF